MIDAATLAQVAQRRASTYWLLSSLVLDAPTPEALAQLDAALGDPPLDLDVPLGKETMALRDAVREASGAPQAMMALRVEHTRLLGGLSKNYGAPAPYESVFCEDKLPGEATVAVAAACAEAGLELPAPDVGPADHLGSELRMMAMFCHRESEAWGEGDGSAQVWIERERDFLDAHVLEWVPQHCQRLAAMAADAYHRAVFTLVANACVLDRGDIEQVIAEAALEAA